MRLQTLTGKFPTEKPPDPKNESPGTARTVSWAEVQSIVLPSVRSAAPAVYDGQDRVGSVVEHDGQHYADTAGDQLIGVFRSRIGAARGIPAKGSVS